MKKKENIREDLQKISVRHNDSWEVHLKKYNINYQTLLYQCLLSFQQTHKITLITSQNSLTNDNAQNNLHLPIKYHICKLATLRTWFNNWNYDGRWKKSCSSIGSIQQHRVFLHINLRLQNKPFYLGQKEVLVFLSQDAISNIHQVIFQK